MKLKIFLPLLALALAVTACDDKLDIVPKGQSTLETVDDLSLLLNAEVSLGTPMTDLGVLCNEDLSMGTNVALTLGQTNTVAYANLTYDESVDRANLTLSDDRYNSAYKAINAMNTIIVKAPDASGDDALRKQIIAEAHIRRAYYHFLLVNLYARQYDSATADTDGGIAYVDNIDPTAVNAKLTLQQTYDRILDDCADDYIAQMPVEPSSVLRAGQAFGYAVRAKVLMQMKRYSDALPYALKAIELHPTLEDRSTIVEAGDWVLPRTAANNLLYMGSATVAPFMECLSPETAARFEAGDYVLYHAYQFGMKPGTGGDGDDDDDWGDDDDDWADDDDDDDLGGGLGDDDDYGEDWAKANPDVLAKMATAAKAGRAALTTRPASTRAVCSDVYGGRRVPHSALDDETLDLTNKAWNSMFGMMYTGVSGALMYFAMSSWQNCWGITTDRMYYCAAECYIRTGQIQKGIDLINTVRQLRIDADHYVPLTASTEQEAMALLQDCKWIECIDTYENFFDTKRWNSEPAYARTITRSLSDLGTFSIAPTSKLWVLPFPLNATRINKTLTQND